MKLRLIGDIHGKYFDYQRLLNGDASLQVGDMGCGFADPPILAEQHKFIRGNHDAPHLARAHPNYAGEYGVWNGVFFCGGADSIDKHLRIEGRSWWRDEELSYTELEHAFDLYDETRPAVVVTHDAPTVVGKHMVEYFGGMLTGRDGRPVYHPTRTSQALQRMWEVHHPKLWVFGHWHANENVEIGRTLFVCLKELAVLDIDTERI